MSGETKPKRKKASGPSGKHLVPKRNLRVDDELWERFVAATAGRNRNEVINELIAAYCAASMRPR